LVFSDECQISLHKNHRYLFIDEAIQNQKSNLHSLVNKVRDVRLILNKIQQTRHQQRSDIDQTERQVVDDIKLFGLNMITEVSKACKQLINDTTTLCHQARTQFTEK
jgi:tripartite motif-containing protein 33